MVVSDVITYKSKLMDRLINIPDIFTLIDNPDIATPTEMINQNIYSFIKIPNTTLQVKNYICFDYNSKEFTKNPLLKNVTINLTVVCHEDNIKTDWGNRHDVLAGIITDSFTWSDFLGFELEFVSDTESVLENVYHLRTLQFRNITQNSLENGVRMDGF